MPSGSDLFSHTLESAVSSALRRFTSVFGMGTGGAASLEPPGTEAKQSDATLSRQLFNPKPEPSFEVYLLRLPPSTPDRVGALTRPIGRDSIAPQLLDSLHEMQVISQEVYRW